MTVKMLTRHGIGNAYETLVFAPGIGLLAYGRGINQAESQRSARNVFNRQKRRILSVVEKSGQWMTVETISQSVRMPRITVETILLLSAARRLLIIRQTPDNRVWYRTP